MNNKNMFYLTIIALVAIGVLFLTDIKNILQNSSAYPETYIKHNEVSGIAVEIEGRLYTLDFEDQNAIIDSINRSLPVATPETLEFKPDFQKMIVYTFGKAPDIQITPLGFSNSHDLIFSAPLLEPTGYLMDVSEGKMQEIVNKVNPKYPL
jgi:hypothetical protein